MSSRLRMILKAAVTLALLGFLLYRMDLGKFADVLASADWTLVFAAGVLHLATVPPSVVRWRSVLGNFDIHTPFWKLTQICLIGYFFNMFLPSAIGGDFFRAYYLSRRESKGMSTTLTSTVVDRIAGLAAMLLIALVTVLFYPITVHGQSLLPIVLLLGAGFVVGIGALFNSTMHRLVRRLFDRFGMTGLEEKFELVSRGLGLLRRNGKAIVIVVVVSVLLQMTVIVAMWLAARSIGLDAPFRLFLIFIPLVNLSVAVPMTINGVGLRESMYYLLFSEIGVPVEMAVTLSLLNLAVVAMTALPGGVVYSLYKREQSFPIEG